VTGNVSDDKPFNGGCTLRALPYNINTITQILEKGNPKEIAIRTISLDGTVINNWQKFTLQSV
jgi:hypothetical protein